ncbi:hypothetical protein SCHIN_v1c01320 [Spiroplasma chinense]|uniref:Uncharacterized protein n=1 Tax=Spiroplasma chinense TaxID=216932 RepID=A0A5B9Y2R9_9MOLU|nr:hypothetical protein [Spiroplasma chinense]QEH61330.1 hypothetical protein SCHIN_v1c01320 [Spiroplasma chinense]
MKKTGRLMYAISSAVSLAFTLIVVILLVTAVGAAGSGLEAEDKTAVAAATTVIVVLIALLSIPTILAVVFGFKSNEKLQFAGAIIAIIVGGLSLFAPFFLESTGFGSLVLGILMIVGGGLYLGGKN